MFNLDIAQKLNKKNKRIIAIKEFLFLSSLNFTDKLLKTLLDAKI